MSANMTMLELRRIDYCLPAWSKLTTDKKTLQISSLKYIDHLARLTNTDIDHWRVLEFFVNSEGYVRKERNKVNEIFFQLRKTLPSKPEEPKSSLPIETLQQLDRLSLSMADGYKKEVKSSIDTLNNEIRSYDSEIESNFSHIEHYRAERLKRESLLDDIDRRLSSPPNVIPQIRQVLNEGWWSLPDKHPDGASIFLATPTLFLRELNTAQAINRIVDMGRVLVELWFTNTGMGIGAYAYENCPMIRRYYHPHIDNEAICYGSAQSEVNSLLRKLDVVKLLELTKTVLEQYNPGSPYLRLDAFEEARKLGNIYSRNSPTESLYRMGGEISQAVVVSGMNAMAALYNATTVGTTYSINFNPAMAPLPVTNDAIEDDEDDEEDLEGESEDTEGTF